MSNIAWDEFSGLEIIQDIVDNTVPGDFALTLGRVSSWLGYSNKDEVRQVLVDNFTQGYDYRIQDMDGHPEPISPDNEHITLTIECFKMLAFIAGDYEANIIRMGFIECERIAKTRPPIAHKALLRTLYDLVITKSINYAHAEYAMNQSIPYLSSLGAQSKYTIQACLIFATQALEFVQDGSLRWKECTEIINDHFLSAYNKRKDLDHVFRPIEPLTIADLEDIEFIFYTHYFK